jgi:hypothetical protein
LAECILSQILWYNTHLISRAIVGEQKWYDKIVWTPQAYEEYQRAMAYLAGQSQYLADQRSEQLRRYREQARKYYEDKFGIRR